jgi:hypothetical protein
LLSTRNASINVLFRHADFHLLKPNKQLVHGSRMVALGATLRTSTGKILTVDFNASLGPVFRATVRAASGLIGGTPVKARPVGFVVATTDTLTPGHGVASMAYHRSKTIDDVHVHMQREQVRGALRHAASLCTRRTDARRVCTWRRHERRNCWARATRVPSLLQPRAAGWSARTQRTSATKESRGRCTTDTRVHHSF